MFPTISRPLPCLEPLLEGFLLAGGVPFIYASVMAVAMLDRASLENHRCGLSPSTAPMTEAADTIFVVLVIDLVAQES